MDNLLGDINTLTVLNILKIPHPEKILAGAAILIVLSGILKVIERVRNA